MHALDTQWQTRVTDQMAIRERRLGALVQQAQVFTDRSDLIVTVARGHAALAMSEGPDPTGPVRLRVEAPGYRTTHVEFALGAGTDVLLDRAPVRLTGRVADADGAAAAGVRLWITTALGQPTARVPLREPLRADHPPGTPVAVWIPQPVGPARSVLHAVHGGRRSVRLDLVAGLNPGDRLSLGPRHQRVHRAVTAIDGDRITLDAPLAYTVAAGDPVQAIGPNAPILVTTIKGAAVAGEGIVELHDVLVPPPDDVALVIGGTTCPLGIVSSPTGDYRLDGVVWPVLHIGAPTVTTRRVHIDFSHPQAPLDLRHVSP